jgi:O-antigen/teichoic acid export membrane protein
MSIKGVPNISLMADRLALYRLRAVLTPLLLIFIRGANTLSKFLLALYVTRYLGLADLGVYGLIVGATTVLPAFAGLGTSDWMIRKVAGAPSAQSGPLMTTRLGMVLLFHLLLQPIAFAANGFMGELLPWRTLMLVGAIALLDHMATDAGDMLIWRGRVLFSNILFFLRAGAWPLVVIAAGILFPETRSLDWLLAGWLAGLVVMWLALAAFVGREHRWRHLRLARREMTRGIAESLPFYIKDVSVAANLYLDRFLVSAFLGIEATGIYTFFWSVANVVHNLALHAIFYPKVTTLVEVARTAPQRFATVLHRMEITTGGVALLVAGVLVAAIPPLLPYLDRPLLNGHMPVLWLVIAATILRLAVDSYNYVLLALHYDKAIALLSLAGPPLSALFYVLLIPPLGLNGAALAYLLSAAALTVPRFVLSRRPPSKRVLAPS